MEVIVEGGSFFEAPRWRDGRWWVSDFYRHTVFSFDARGADMRQEATVAGQPSGLGWDSEGALLVVSMLDHQLLRRDPATGELRSVADVSAHAGGPSNDMVVAADGTAWIGNFGFDLDGGGSLASTSLTRVDPDGTVTEAANGLMFPNGAVITDDGHTLILGETFGSRYTSFTIADDRSLTDRRVWADVPAVYPDGCCLDAEGRIWCADAAGRRCVLVEEGRGVVHELQTPNGLAVFACMLGGPEGRTLLMCCCPSSSAGDVKDRRDALLAVVEVDTPHGGRP